MWLPVRAFVATNARVPEKDGGMLGKVNALLSAFGMFVTNLKYTPLDYAV